LQAFAIVFEFAVGVTDVRKIKHLVQTSNLEIRASTQRPSVCGIGELRRVHANVGRRRTTRRQTARRTGVGKSKDGDRFPCALLRRAAALPATLPAFRRAYPDIDLALEEANTPPLITRLREGTLDAAFLRPGAAGHGALQVRRLSEEPMVVALY
jgi:hypothetical protein